MIDINQLFSSVKTELFIPPILAKIKKDLKVDQVFINQLNASGQLEKIINIQEAIIKKKDSFESNLYEISSTIIKQINKTKKSYLSHDNNDLDEDTFIIKRAELVFPIIIKTPEIIILNDNTTLWGVLSIYDYNYERRWQEKEINKILEIVNYLTLTIERSIIFDKLTEKEKQCQSYYLLDDDTGLANYDAFIDCLDYEWRRLTREKQPLSLILLKFKFDEEINKRILGKIGYFIQDEIKRPADLGAYFGDNKIIVMLPNTNENGADWVKKNIFKALAKITNAHQNFQCTAQVTTLIPAYNQDYNFILKNLENSLPNFE